MPSKNNVTIDQLFIWVVRRLGRGRQPELPHYGDIDTHNEEADRK